MSYSKGLTILIPTYNRKDTLTQLLHALAKQTNQSFGVIISDNASDYDVYSILNGLPENFKEKVKIYKRKINCYADVNIIDLFNLCQTEYAWTLSDDEYLHADAVDKIYKYIDVMPEIGVFNFTLDNKRLQKGEKKVIKDIDEFVNWYYDKHKHRNLQHSDLIFLSNKVFNMKLGSPYITWAYRYIYTRVSTEVIFLKMLEDCIPYCIVKDDIVEYNSDNPRSWRIYEVILASRTLSDIPLKPGKYNLKKLYCSLTFPINYVYYLYFCESPEKENINSFFDQIYHGIYKYFLSFSDKLILKIISIVTKKDIGYKLVKKVICTFAKRKRTLMQTEEEEL